MDVRFHAIGAQDPATSITHLNGRDSVGLPRSHNASDAPAHSLVHGLAIVIQTREVRSPKTRDFFVNMRNDPYPGTKDFPFLEGTTKFL